MPRRSYADSLHYNDLIAQAGEPSPAAVRKLIGHAMTCHKERKHHETGAYLQAADVALERWVASFVQHLELDHKANIALLRNVDRRGQAAAPAPAQNVNKNLESDQAAARGYGNPLQQLCDKGLDGDACLHGHETDSCAGVELGNLALCSCAVPPAPLHRKCFVRWGDDA